MTDQSRLSLPQMLMSRTYHLGSSRLIIIGEGVNRAETGLSNRWMGVWWKQMCSCIILSRIL